MPASARDPAIRRRQTGMAPFLAGMALLAHLPYLGTMTQTRGKSAF